MVIEEQTMGIEEQNMATDQMLDMGAEDQNLLTKRHYNVSQCDTESDDGNIITECVKSTSWPVETESEDHEDNYVRMLCTSHQLEEQQLKFDMKYLEKPEYV